MTRLLGTVGLLAALVVAAPAAAQEPLSLTDAIARARVRNLDAQSDAASEREAAQRATQARAGRWPRVDLTESWQRGNQPVFVFGSLLAQRRFTASDFALDALNHPDATDNFRTGVSVEQPILDRATAARVRAGELGRELASEGRRLVDHELAVAVTQAYGRAVAAMAGQRTATAAVDAARADREMAGHRRDAGRATDADVLQLDVHVAQTLERQIRAASDERIARVELNQLIGAPLQSAFILDEATPPAIVEPATAASAAVSRRPDVAMAALELRLAEAAEQEAHAAYLPQVAAQAGWEQNGGTWSTRASSWVVGAVARLNLFRGLADQARLAEAREQVSRGRLAQEKAELSARVDVEAATARLESARARDALGRATVARAIESRRIVRDRYEAGLADVAALLGAEAAVLEAESMQTAARVDVLVESAALQRALGQR